ncbi:MAG: doxx family protein [Verrucomicrobiae bacterium]|nr:doxx family protein [Verrucomicrobiae bacterium]
MSSTQSSSKPSPVPAQSAGVDLIRIALGLNYFHFGYLKFYPDLSPAELIASYTAQRLSLYWIDAAVTLQIIAVMECAIGCALLFNVGLRWVAPAFFFHMAATFLPLFLLPEVTFKFAPLAPTIEGQYILKNFVLVSAGWVVFAPHLRFLHRRAQSKVCAADVALEPATAAAVSQSPSSQN